MAPQSRQGYLWKLRPRVKRESGQLFLEALAVGFHGLFSQSPNLSESRHSMSRAQQGNAVHVLGTEKAGEKTNWQQMAVTIISFLFCFPSRNTLGGFSKMVLSQFHSPQIFYSLFPGIRLLFRCFRCSIKAKLCSTFLVWLRFLFQGPPSSRETMSSFLKYFLENPSIWHCLSFFSLLGDCEEDTQ